MAWRHKHLKDSRLSLYEREYEIDATGKLNPDPVGQDLRAAMLLGDFEEIAKPPAPTPAPQKAQADAPKKRGRPAKPPIKKPNLDSEEKSNNG